jgi:hypothetical protein
MQRLDKSILLPFVNKEHTVEGWLIQLGISRSGFYRWVKESVLIEVDSNSRKNKLYRVNDEPIEESAAKITNSEFFESQPRKEIESFYHRMASNSVSFNLVTRFNDANTEDDLFTLENQLKATIIAIHYKMELLHSTLG